MTISTLYSEIIYLTQDRLLRRTAARKGEILPSCLDVACASPSRRCSFIWYPERKLAIVRDTEQRVMLLQRLLPTP
jgi:hypothetical protein